MVGRVGARGQLCATAFPRRRLPKDLPFLPVLLVVWGNWELYFAFEGIASSRCAGRSYRLLAVLLLVGWVAGEFREWVELLRSKSMVAISGLATSLVR